MADKNAKHGMDGELASFVQKLRASESWLDEKYALPVDESLLQAFLQGQTNRQVTKFVVSQVTGFRSWRDALLDVIRRSDAR